MHFLRAENIAKIQITSRAGKLKYAKRSIWKYFTEKKHKTTVNQYSYETFSYR